MTDTARLGLPMIEAGQVDKATTHNEALAQLDLLAAAAIDGFLIDAPPASPAIGNCYVVGAAPTGAWAGHALALAGYTDGGWRFIATVEGLRAVDKTSGEIVVFCGGAWEKGHVRATKLSVGSDQVVGARLPAVADPIGGSNVDVEARAAIGQILARLRTHGLVAS